MKLNVRVQLVKPHMAQDMFLTKTVAVRAINPFAPSDFAEKCHMKLVVPLPGRHLASRKLTTQNVIYISNTVTTLAFVPDAK